MKKLVLLVLVIMISAILWGCFSSVPPLKGFYQSDVTEGYMIQMLFQEKDSSFTQWIDNRKVDTGNFEKIDDNLYEINGQLQNFEVEVSKDNTFGVIVGKINDGQPIVMKNVSPKDHRVDFADWDDVEEYKLLLK